METAQQVLRTNLLRLRKERGQRQDDLAEAVREVGLEWTQATVAAIETGNRKLSLEEVFLLAVVLRIPLADLLVTEDKAIDFSGVRLSSTDAARVAKGELVFIGSTQAAARVLAERSQTGLAKHAEMARRYGVPDREIWKAGIASLGDPEGKAARRLGVSAFDVAAAALSLWGHRLGQERDRRVSEGPKTSDLRARRGHVTRALLKELRERIDAAGRQVPSAPQSRGKRLAATQRKSRDKRNKPTGGSP
jgi:transcriptional regulator with XRE-family HTH domain